MIGIRSAISIRARGHWPHLEAVYMTAPRSFRRKPKKPLPRGGRPYMTTSRGKMPPGGETRQRIGQLFAVERLYQKAVHAGLKAGVAVLQQRVRRQREDR